MLQSFLLLTALDKGNFKKKLVDSVPPKEFELARK